MTRYWTWIVLAAFLAACSGPEQSDISEDADVLGIAGVQTDSGQCAAPVSRRWSPYLDASWPTIHTDPGNADFTDDESPLTMGSPVYHLPSTATLVGQTVDDARGLLYQTSGRPGEPHLHAFSIRTGQLAWSSAGWQATPPLDACAAGSTAIIDRDGNTYVSDCAYLWSSAPTGKLRWRQELPADGAGRRWPFVTAFFTASGEVGGVSVGGMVSLHDRTTGAVVATLQLEGLIDPPDPDSARSWPALIDRCMWRDAAGAPMIDRNLVSGLLSGAVGVGVPVANTPAVRPLPEQPQSVTHIFVPGVLRATGAGGDHHVKLFRVEARHDAATGKTSLVKSVGFAGMMLSGKGSATSPTLSADGCSIFVGNNKGYLHAFDTRSGTLRWKTLVGSMYGSVSAPHRTVNGASLPLIVAGDRTITALDSVTGKLRWQKTYAVLAEQRVPKHGPLERVSLVAGTLMSSPGRLIVPFTLGYRVPSLSQLTVWPMASVMAVLDHEGNLVGTPLSLHDVAETSGRVDRAGNVHVGFASTASSMAHCMWRENTLGIAGALPQPLRPVGGVGTAKGLTW